MPERRRVSRHAVTRRVDDTACGEFGTFDPLSQFMDLGAADDIQTMAQCCCLLPLIFLSIEASHVLS